MPALHAFRSLISPELSIVQILPQADRAVLVARPKAMETCFHVAAAEPAASTVTTCAG
uniref:Truncated transposase n=1 Tax=Rhizobium loti TaxID=381 RepID=M5AM32_RHILI|nr:truncated transposase [Mesorhizobium loti NZP2037]